MYQLKNVCVYCGSSIGRNPRYKKAAQELAHSLQQRQLGLVYGAASIGIMGEIADQMLSTGGKVTGVIPKALSKKEITHASLTHLHITESMHERKMKMAELSDGFIAMPGGIGTMEELFEIWTWAQLGFHSKPCGLLNIDGYYDNLIAFLNDMQEQQFIKERQRKLLIIATSAEALLNEFTRYEAPALPEWINKEQT